MSTLAMNGTSMTSPQSLSADESEESFVVLSPSLAPDNMESMMSVNCSMVNSAASISPMPQISKEMSQAINAMSVSATSELSPDEIHTKLESLLHENLQLKETLHQNNLAMKKQFTTLVAWQEDVMKVHQSHKEKFEETKKLIANLRAENSELKKATSLPHIQTDADTEKIYLKSKIVALEFDLDTLRQGYLKNQSEQDAKLAELTERVKEKDENIMTLNSQVNNLRTELSSSQEKLHVAQRRILELAEKIPTVSTAETLEKLNNEIAELTADLEYKNKVLKDKTEIADKLTEECKKLENENQTIPIYKTQVDLYQKDFNAEREARNSLHAEKECIANDLRLLQGRNKDLMEELEKMRAGDHFVVVNAATTSAPRESTPPSQIYMCPLCSSRFRTLKLLEQHCENCIS